MPPFDQTLEATLTADGDQTILVIEVQGMPLDKIAFYGAGWQIHAENLAAYLAGRERGDTEARWDELVPAYQDLAANVHDSMLSSRLGLTLDPARVRRNVTG